VQGYLYYLFRGGVRPWLSHDETSAASRLSSAFGCVERRWFCRVAAESGPRATCYAASARLFVQAAPTWNAELGDSPPAASYLTPRKALASR